jgi:hypothetical protein
MRVYSVSIVRVHILFKYYLFRGLGCGGVIREQAADSRKADSRKADK